MARATSPRQSIPVPRLPALTTVALSVLLVLLHVDSPVLGAPFEGASGNSIPDSSVNGLDLNIHSRISNNKNSTPHTIDYQMNNASVHVLELPADDLNWSRHDRILFFTVPFEASIVIRSFVFLYCCLVIAYLCDEYFVPSLEDIGEALNFSNDLIGAILIPFGTSGPEIFSSAVGVFFAQNDIGTGAIIGSAVFNMLAIPAACGLAAAYFLGDSIRLQEAPIMRDLLFYAVSIMVLILVVKDSTVDLLDSSLLILLFVLYICVILYNFKFQSTPADAHDHVHQIQNQNNNNNNKLPYQSYVGPIVTINNQTHDNRIKPQQLNDKNVQVIKPYKSMMKQYLNKCNEIMTGEKDAIMDKVAKLYSQQEKVAPFADHYFKDAKCIAGFDVKLHAFIEDVIKENMSNKDRGAKCKTHYEKIDDDEDDNGFGLADNYFLGLLLLPFRLIFYLTMPTSFSYIIFLFSITWLSILSYLTVWSISGLSTILGISPSLSGMTILAAGSAIPDLVTAILVIKKTRAASMGICAAIASNIFAILLGLGLPWFIRVVLNWCQTGIYASSAVVLESNALPFTSVILLGTLFFLYFTFRICKWKISIRFALICAIIHIAFIASNITLEVLIGNS